MGGTSDRTECRIWAVEWRCGCRDRGSSDTDSAYAPGTGTPEPNGLTPRELFPLLRRLGAETNLVGVEMVELNPLVDPTYVTPLVANRCAREILTGVAMRRKGITGAHYLAPETIDHGQS